MRLCFRRKLLIILIPAGIAFLILLGLFFTRKNSFHNFCDEVFATQLNQDTLGLHYTLAHPDKFGIDPSDATLPLYHKEDALEDYRLITEYAKALQSFDPQKMTGEEKYTQKLLANSFSLELEGQQYFYLQETFSPASGIQIQFPILMAEYTFRCKKDIENYLSLLKMTPGYFESYCNFAKEKANRGFCMPNFSLEKVIYQCNHLITQKDLEDKNHFLISTFEERLQKAVQNELITEMEADDFRRTNYEYLKTYVLKGYQNLGKALETFIGSGKNENGLCFFENGTDYYAWLFKNITGSDVPLNEVYLSLAKNYYNSMQSLKNDLISFQNTSSLTDADLTYFSLTDSSDILSDLANRMEKDFPSASATFNIPHLQASVKDVSPSLENYTAPAYYLVPPLDDNSQNSIYINRSMAPSGLELYTTLAHEGYPGHLYQTTYYQLYRADQNLPYLRSTLNYSGYVEGWALYVELLSYEYASNLLIEDTGNEDYRLLFDIYKQERCASLAFLSLLDIGIHYYGMDLARVTELMNDHGITDSNTISDIYEYIIEEPCNYPKYYWGSLQILELKELAKQEMGDTYSDYSFHKFFLESGPSDFTSLRERLTEK